MSWSFILIGIMLISVGLVLKYQQIKAVRRKRQAGEGGKELLVEADLLKHRNKLQEINHDLDLLIKQINLKEKIIKEQLEERLPVKEDFKELLKQEYSQNKGLRLADKYSKVIALSRQGLRCQDIAQELDLGIRETSLIIKFYRKEEDSVV